MILSVSMLEETNLYPDFNPFFR